MIKRLIFLLLLSGLIFGSLFAMKFYQIQIAKSQFKLPPPAVVAVIEAKQVNWQSSLSAVGSLVAVSGVTLSNEIAGIVKVIHFTSGQSVHKGQLLLELNAETERAELKGLLAQQRLAKIRFERSRKLIHGNFVPKSNYDENKALLDEAAASVLTKQTLIEKKQIHAPFSGQLGIRKIDLGQYLTPGSAIVTLQHLDPIYVDFKLPERHLDRLTTGQQVIVNIQTYPDTSFTGRISTISPLIDQNTRSVKIRATLPNPEHLLHPGMFAQAVVVSDQTRQVLTVPNTAISYNPYGAFVFVVEPDKQGLIVQSRLVKTGMTRNGRVEIVRGLNHGDRVVSAGQIKLRNGMPVTIGAKPAPGERLTAPSSRQVPTSL